MQPVAAFGPAQLEGLLAPLIGKFPRAHIAVAFSGGADSTALLAALATLARRHRHLALRAVHVDHGLQPGSRRWARHCVQLARALRVRIIVRRVSVDVTSGQSHEAAARTARYAAFAHLLDADECLVTAHTLEDQAETVLLQLLRGAGVEGLCAMHADAPLARGRLVRPLLDVSRAALREYVRSRGLRWIEDPMNLDLRFDRVYLRQEILPRLGERWPGAPRALARSARHAQDARRLLAGIAREDIDAASDGQDLSVTVLRRLPIERRRNALRLWIAQQGGRMPQSRHLAGIAGPLLAARADALPAVSWAEGTVRRAAGRLSWQPAEMPSTASSPPAAPLPSIAAVVDAWSWRDNPVMWLPGARGRLELRPDAYGDLDLETLPATLAVRWRLGGERLRPRPGGPSRTVKSLLQAARIAPWERAAVPLVYADEHLTAVADRWIDAAHQAREGARARGRIVWHRTPRRARPGSANLVG